MFIPESRVGCLVLKKCLAEFLCGDDGDCNGKGTCVDSKCNCVPGWDSSFDCHGEYLMH